MELGVQGWGQVKALRGRVDFAEVCMVGVIGYGWFLRCAKRLA